MQRICDICITSKKGKPKILPHGWYIPLHVPQKSWVDIYMNFVLGLSMSKKDRDSIFFVVDRFSNISHFITCHKINEATNITNLFIREII